MQGASQKIVLVIHGLSGTARTMQPLIDELERAGFAVTAPLLPGHGTTHEDLAEKKWEEWWDTVRAEFERLTAHNGKIFVAGLSMGSLLALKLAEEFPDKVTAIAAIGTPLKLPPFIENIAYYAVKYTPLRYFYKYSKKDIEKTVLDKEGQEYYRNNSYPYMPIASVLELFKLKKIVREDLSKITSPVLVVHGRYDKMAPVENADILKWALLDREILILENSAHVVTLDVDRDEASKAVVAFFKKFS